MSDPWWPTDYDYPAFRVKRTAYGINEGGDYVRGSAGGHDGVSMDTIITLPRTALRYPTKAFDPTAVAAADKGILFTTAFDYFTISVEWSWPKAVRDTFLETAVVRSTFGAPADPSQGEVVFRAMRSALPVYAEDYTVAELQGKLQPPPIIYDTLIPPKLPNGDPGMPPNGHWYYYTAFFRTNPYDWTPMMSDQCLLPRNHHHSDHLWETLPPWYQFTDDTYQVGKGFLRRFLTIFGFELDRTREYVESLLKLHWADQSPMLLLRHLGANYGYPYEAGIGDIRYRALLANLSQLLLKRGTSGGLLGLVETVSKYDCDITMGKNTTLLPDDSNFVTGTGHWAPIHPDVNLDDPPETDFLAWDKVTLTWQKPGIVLVPEDTPAALGTMLVTTLPADTADIFLVAGAGKLPTKEFVPYYSGIPVDPHEVYGYSFWIKMAAPSEVTGYLLFFTDTGQYGDIAIGDSESPGVVASLPIVPVADEWTEVPMNAMVPVDGHYMVPAIYINARSMTGATTTSPPITVAAVMVYGIDSDAPVSIQAPDRYLTLGDPAEKIGATTDDDGTGHPYKGYTLGAPETVQTISSTDTSVRPSGGSFFTNDFRDRLFADPTLMDPMTIKVSLLRSAPSMVDIDDGWRDVVTLDDLTALPGWVEVQGISGYPLTATLDVSTLPIAIPDTTRFNHFVIFNTAYPFDELNESVQIEGIAVEEVAVGGNKLIFVSNTPVGDQTNLARLDTLTANPDSNLPGASNRWLFSWSDPPSGATTVDPHEGLLAFNRAAPEFEASNTAHIWLYPSRCNMIANPSFEALGMNYWAGPSGTRVRDARFMPDLAGEVANKDALPTVSAPHVGDFYATTDDDHVWGYIGPNPNNGIAKWKDHGLPTEGSFVGNFVGSAPFAVESNVWVTRQGGEDHPLWTLQLLAKGDGQLKLGLVGWDSDMRGVIVDWGKETWDLYPDAWIHIIAVRNCPDAHEAMMRIEVNGTEVSIDRVLAERGALREWPYFDGDSTFALQDSYSWYGGPLRRGASYSMWYDMRRAVMGRLFATPVDTIYPGDVLSDAEVALAGMVYKWVPAGVTVIPHIDVFYPNDLRSPPIMKDGDSTLGYFPTDPNGVPNPWV